MGGAVGGPVVGLHRNLEDSGGSGGFMGIHDLPKKWRERAHGDAGMLTCVDELEAQIKNAVLCYVAAGPEIHFELIIPDDVFHATIKKPSSCTLSTKSGDTRRAVLLFD